MSAQTFTRQQRGRSSLRHTLNGLADHGLMGKCDQLGHDDHRIASVSENGSVAVHGVLLEGHHRCRNRALRKGEYEG